MRKPYSYDSRCEDLADVFLDDMPRSTERDAFDLAQEIQETIESFLRSRFDREPDATPAGAVVAATSGVTAGETAP